MNDVDNFLHHSGYEGNEYAEAAVRDFAKWQRERMTATQQPSVTQADIDASDTLEENMDGHWTEPMRVFVAKAFARHRIAAEATQAAEIARLREALGYMLRAWDCEVGEDADILLAVKEGAKVFSVASARAALSAQPSEQVLPNDVVRLVIAARTMAFGDWCCEGEDYEVARKELDDAAEAFASRVEWPDTPSERGEGGE